MTRSCSDDDVREAQCEETRTKWQTTNKNPKKVKVTNQKPTQK